MGLEELRRKQQEMEKAQTGGEAQPSPEPPQGGGSVSGDAPSPGDQFPKGSPRRAEGAKSMPEKQGVAEGVIAKAKAEDVEDSREETSGLERHDLVIPTHPNIPPTIQQERMRLGQHPITGEPWTPQEKQAWGREQEQARVKHAEAVRLSEERMRQDKVAAPAIQPTPHVPTNFLTEEQKMAMQESQDRGDSPVRQAQVRDANHPDEVGKAEAERRIQMGETRRSNREDVGVDEDIERAELGEEDSDELAEEQENEEEKDADELESEIERRSDR